MTESERGSAATTPPESRPQKHPDLQIRRTDTDRRKKVVFRPPTKRERRELKYRARFRRECPTPAEAVLWKAVRKFQICGATFRQQHRIGPLIVDFFCAAAGLVIEIRPDGLKWGFKDEVRYLEGRGFAVLRFSESEVVEKPGWVHRLIWGVCKDRLETSSPPESDDAQDSASHQSATHHDERPLPKNSEAVGEVRAAEPADARRAAEPTDPRRAAEPADARRAGEPADATPTPRRNETATVNSKASGGAVAPGLESPAAASTDGISATGQQGGQRAECQAGKDSQDTQTTRQESRYGQGGIDSPAAPRRRLLRTVRSVTTLAVRFVRTLRRIRTRRKNR